MYQGRGGECVMRVQCVGSLCVLGTGGSGKEGKEDKERREDERK